MKKVLIIRKGRGTMIDRDTANKIEDMRKVYRGKILSHTLGDTLADLRDALDTSLRAGAFYASYQSCIQIEALERIIEDQVNIACELMLEEGDPFLD